MWHWLTEPATSVRAPTARRQARLLATLLGIITPLTLNGAFMTFSFVPNSTPFVLLLGGAALLFGMAYGLSRTSQYKWGGWLTIVVLLVLPHLTLRANHDFSEHSLLNFGVWTLPGVLLAGQLLSPWGVALVAVGNFASLALEPVMIPTIAYSRLFTPLSFVGVISALILALGRHRDLVEQERLNELSEANGKLTTLYHSLEQRVHDRTADLTAANDALQAEIAERKRVAEAAQLSEERFQLVSYATSDAVWDYDLTQETVWWNRGVQTLFGYGPNDVEPVMKWWEDRLHPDDRAKVLTSFQNMLARQEEFWSKEYRFRRANGTYAHVFDRAYVIHNSDQRPVRVVGAMLDVTGLKHAETALRESEEYLRLLFEHSPDAILLIDPHSTPVPWAIVDCNAAAGHMNGYTRAELIGQSIDILHTSASDPDALALHLTRLRETGLLQYEKVYRRRDGQLLPVEVSTSIVTIAGRELVLGIDRDITQRKLAEQALHESENRYRELFTTAQRQAHELAALDQVRTTLSRELDLSVILRTIVEAIVGFFEHCRAAIYFVEGDELVCRAIAGGDDKLDRLPLTAGIMGQVARTGQYVWLEDVNSDPRFVRTASDIISEICVPLFDQGQVMGVLKVETSDGVTLSQADLSLTLALSEHVNVAIGRARLHAAMRDSEMQYRRQAVHLQIAAEIARSITSLLDLEQILARVTDLIWERFAYYHVNICLVNETREWVVLRAASGEGAQSLRQKQAWLALTDRSLITHTVNTGQANVAQDVLTEPLYRPHPLLPDVRAEAVLPLRVGEAVLGVLDVESAERNTFTPDIISILSIIADQTAIAIETARLFAATQQQAQEIAALYHASAQLLNPGVGVNGVAEQIARAVTQEFATVNCSVLLLNAESTELIRAANVGDFQVTGARTLSMTGSGLTVAAAHSGETLYAPDVRAEPRYLAKDSRTCSELVVPMLVGERVLGVLDLQSPQVDGFDERARRIVDAFAKHAGLALENARLHVETAQQVHDLAALLESSSVLSSTLQLDQVLNQAAEHLTRTAQAQAAILFRWDKETDTLVALAHSSRLAHLAAQAGSPYRLADYPHTEAILRTGEPSVVHLDDPQANPAEQALMHELGAQGLLVLPLISRGQTVGLAEIYQTARGEKFVQRAVTLCQALAHHVAIAIENAQLLANLEQAYNTLQAEQKKLLLSEKMASLGRLTAGIAHEMNTPLATVRTALSELNSLIIEYQTSIGDLQVTSADHLAIASDMMTAQQLADTAAERAASFVRGIKAQTRDLAPHEHQHFDAVGVIQETLTLLGHALRRGQCTAEFLSSADRIELHGSPGRLAQVVTNLVTNAIDASAPHGGPIELKLMRLADHVELRVSDHGGGIAPDDMPKIFDPMFTTKPFGEGTGLGLTIVHDIVTGDFRGTVEVTSQLGRGTTFNLHFPHRQEHTHGA